MNLGQSGETVDALRSGRSESNLVEVQVLSLAQVLFLALDGEVAEW